MASDDNILVFQLLAEAVPEIPARIIEIIGIARKRGVRCKVLLKSRDPQVDCIGTCVGARGSRIRQVIDALKREPVDLIRWHESMEVLIANALQPGEVKHVSLSPTDHLAVVTVRPSQSALVRGRRGENLELASQLSGWRIEIDEVGKG